MTQFFLALAFAVASASGENGTFQVNSKSEGDSSSFVESFAASDVVMPVANLEDFNAIDKKGFNPVHVAVTYNSMNALSRLGTFHVSRGAQNVCFAKESMFGKTQRKGLFVESKISMVVVFIPQKGLYSQFFRLNSKWWISPQRPWKGFNAPDKRGRTPAHLACQYVATNITQYLETQLHKNVFLRLCIDGALTLVLSRYFEHCNKYIYIYYIYLYPCSLFFF